MAPVFWFEITDWKNEIVLVSDILIENDIYFSSESMKTIPVRSSLNSLRYFDTKADLDLNKIKTKFNILLKKINFINYNAFKLFSDYKKSFYYKVNEIVASRSVISRIMNTPFEINLNRRKWIIKAELFGNENSIFLYYDQDEEKKLSEEMAKQYEMLKRYLFAKFPISYHRKVTSAYNEMFASFIEAKLGSHEICYTTEIPGIVSNTEITSIEQLNTVEPIYCDIFEDGEYSEDLINYNPIWWSKAALLNAKQCIIASYDKNNDCIKNIYKFNIDKFEDKTKYENLWSPDAAWNFLNDFLQFVKDSVKSVSSDVKGNCMWKFQSFPDDEPTVSCEILALII
ncbi:hypothetical protein O3M35_008089 [Rhynocoris fuscipes]|uniref:Decapping nuclease n=1 Tax=Rhynocoris fuscipes TaxID=488301 RepID=A0AAW1D547_9HEMI